MGFMDSLKAGIKKASEEAKAKAEKERQEQEEREMRLRDIEHSMRIYDVMKKDKKYLSMQASWDESRAKIDESYSVINSLNAFNETAGNKFLQQCEKHILLSKELEPYWNKYEVTCYWGDTYKKIALAYEKRGEYFNSAQACIRAINDGFTDDRTAGGYRGRLARMIKKGKFEPTEEMQKILLEIFE